LNSSSTNKYISRTVTTGQTYYIKVTPYSSSYSGTYKILFTTSTGLPITLPSENITTLTENVWVNGNLPANGEQWFTFTATAGTQYIHASLGALTLMYVQVYDSSGSAVGVGTGLSSSSTYISRTVSTGQTYYIKVMPYGNGSGTYQIVFNTGIFPPSVPLTLNTWENGNLPANGEQWFTFTATADPQYIHASFGTLRDLNVRVYNSSGTTVGDSTNYLSSSSTYISRPVATGQTYYIKVTPYSSSGSGTYQIAFNTGGIPPGVTPTALTFNTWAYLFSTEQWFTFTATANTQYIHVFFNSLTTCYVQVYDSSGAEVGDSTSLSDSSGNSRYITRSVTTGQTYYIKVNGGSSANRIGFNTSTYTPSN
jgi:predicted RNA-binding protein with TRAM domain